MGGNLGLQRGCGCARSGLGCRDLYLRNHGFGISMTLSLALTDSPRRSLIMTEGGGGKGRCDGEEVARGEAVEEDRRAVKRVGFGDKGDGVF